MFKQFLIKDDCRLTKVEQVANTVKEMIDRRELNEDERLPSITIFSRQCKVSRDTVEKAYNTLKREGYISAVKGKGYFVKPRRFGPIEEICIHLKGHHSDLIRFREVLTALNAVLKQYNVDRGSKGDRIRKHQGLTYLVTDKEGKALTESI